MTSIAFTAEEYDHYTVCSYTVPARLLGSIGTYSHAVEALLIFNERVRRQPDWSHFLVGHKGKHQMVLAQVNPWADVNVVVEEPVSRDEDFVSSQTKNLPATRAKGIEVDPYDPEVMAEQGIKRAIGWSSMRMEAQDGWDALKEQHPSPFHFRFCRPTVRMVTPTNMHLVARQWSYTGLGAVMLIVGLVFTLVTLVLCSLPIIGPIMDIPLGFFMVLTTVSVYPIGKAQKISKKLDANTPGLGK